MPPPEVWLLVASVPEPPWPAEPVLPVLPSVFEAVLDSEELSTAEFVPPPAPTVAPPLLPIDVTPIEFELPPGPVLLTVVAPVELERELPLLLVLPVSSDVALIPVVAAESP